MPIGLLAFEAVSLDHQWTRGARLKEHSMTRKIMVASMWLPLSSRDSPLPMALRAAAAATAVVSAVAASVAASVADAWAAVLVRVTAASEVLIREAESAAPEPAEAPEQLA